MNSRQAKNARCVAHQNAQRSKIWKIGEASLYKRWYRKVLAFLFPKIKARYTNAIGRWYKKIIKLESRNAYAMIHDRDWKAYLSARKKVMK